MLFPLVCVVCGDARERTELCRACVGRLVPAPRLPDLTLPSRDLVLASVPVQALVTYDATSRAIVLALKNHNARRLARRLGPSLAALVDRRDLDLVTWAPTTSRRRRERGFDHAEVLARSTASALDLPAVGLLKRLPGPAQHGRDATQRRTNTGFQATADRGGPGVLGPSPGVRGARVLIVDDVTTTGATLTAAATTLLVAGAGAVHGLVIAHAPLDTSLKEGPAEAETLSDTRRRSITFGAF